MTAGVLELTGDGVTVKLAVVAPELTVTDAGTEAEPLLLESATLVLLAGATFSVTVQVEVAGAVMLAGLHVRLVGTAAAAGRRVNENVFEVLFSVAVITAGVLEVTGDGVTVKLAAVEPKLTVTEAGTEAEPLLLESATLALLVAATFRVTVQFEVAGAVMLAGLHATFVGTGVGGSRVRENVFEVLFSVAVITAGVLEVTGDGVTVKLAVVEPKLTVTEAGTEAEPLLLESATLVLLAGATFRVTVQFEVAGAVMLAGLHATFVGTGVGGSRVRENVFEVLFSVAVITAGVLELTGDGVTVKLAVVAPELTVTEAGTEAEPLLESATLVLLAGATFRVTVQVEVAGAVMLAGLHVRLVGTGAGGSRVRENVFELLFSAAVITAGVLEPTGDGVTVKVAVVEPEFTVTEAGTEADPLLLESATLVLLAGATFRVTVQVDVAGAVMLAGLHVRLVGTGAGGSRVTENVFELLFSVAVMTAGVLALTGDGVTVKLAVVEPEFTVTEAGTEADPLLLESATPVLLAGATFRVTVQVEVAGAVMLAGLHVRLVGTGAGGSRVSENVFEVLFSAAVMTAGVLELTGDGVTVKLAVVEPELTVTEAGTEADPLLLESATPVLLAGATFRVTVQVEVAGAVMLAGLHVRLVGTGAGGSRVRENVFEVLFSAAVITAGVLEPTGDGVTVKVAVVAPELTVTEAGTEADELLLESATLVLLVGATFSVTVQVEVAGAVMLVGLQFRLVGTGAGGSKVRENVLEVLFRVAVITTGVLEPTGDGVTLKLAAVEPELTVTEAGTEADELLLESATLVLLVGATFSVTVQVEVAGAVMLVGLQFRLVGTGAGGSRVRENVFEVLFSVAVITVGVLELTGDGVTVKLAVVVPELTVTEAGTEADGLLLESATLVLLVGATFRVTVQAEVEGAVMLAGLHVRLVGTGRVGWLMVTVAPLTVTAIDVPPPVDAEAPTSVTGDEVAVVLPEI